MAFKGAVNLTRKAIADIYDELTSDHVDVGSTGRALDDLAAGQDTQFSNVFVDLTSTGVTNVINVTEAGKLFWIMLNVSNPVTGTPIVRLELQIDGGSTRTKTLWSSQITWGMAVKGLSWNDKSDPGDAQNDRLFIPVNARYVTSCRVGLNIVTAASAGNAQFDVLRGTKI